MQLYRELRLRRFEKGFFLFREHAPPRVAMPCCCRIASRRQSELPAIATGGACSVRGTIFERRSRQQGLPLWRLSWPHARVAAAVRPMAVAFALAAMSARRSA